MEEKENYSNDKIKITQLKDKNVFKHLDTQRLCQKLMKRLRVLTIKRNININEVNLALDIKQFQLENTQIDNQTRKLDKNIQSALSDVVEGNDPRYQYAVQRLYDNLDGWPLQQYGLKKHFQNKQNKSSKPILYTGTNPWKFSMLLSPNQWIGYSSLYAISIVPVL